MLFLFLWCCAVPPFLPVPSLADTPAAEKEGKKGQGREGDRKSPLCQPLFPETATTTTKEGRSHRANTFPLFLLPSFLELAPFFPPGRLNKRAFPPPLAVGWCERRTDGRTEVAAEASEAMLAFSSPLPFLKRGKKRGPPYFSLFKGSAPGSSAAAGKKKKGETREREETGLPGWKGRRRREYRLCANKKRVGKEWEEEEVSAEGAQRARDEASGRGEKGEKLWLPQSSEEIKIQGFPPLLLLPVFLMEREGRKAANRWAGGMGWRERRKAVQLQTRMALLLISTGKERKEGRAFFLHGGLERKGEKKRERFLLLLSFFLFFSRPKIYSSIGGEGKGRRRKRRPFGSLSLTGGGVDSIIRADITVHEEV